MDRKWTVSGRNSVVYVVSSKTKMVSRTPSDAESPETPVRATSTRTTEKTNVCGLNSTR